MNADRDQLLTAAGRIHNQAGCGCDPKYLMSCPRMAAAILEAGAHRRALLADMTRESVALGLYDMPAPTEETP